jgi:hypothetical protein
VSKLLAASVVAVFMAAGLGLSQDAHAGRCSPGNGGGNGGWHGGKGGNYWGDVVKWIKKKSSRD